MSKMSSQVQFAPPTAGMSHDELIAHMAGEIAKLNRMKSDFQRSANAAGQSIVNAITVGGAGSGGGASSFSYHSQSVAVVTTGTPVSFPAHFASGFSFGILSCLDANGNTVGCRITNLTVNGFTATPVGRNATLTYFGITYG